ncbi:MAG: hypothetical protein HYS12_14475 [Planctomycetes bacterium]|nr:hypothetical protein [Planctomycetota bacterium]
MSSLNHDAISKILGSEMRPVKGARFGGFGVLATTAGTAKALREEESELAARKFTIEQDRLVASAFEDVRNGASIDALLWDTDLARRFIERCHEFGLTVPAAALVHRLMHIRKNSKKYARHGITLSPTTRKEPRQSIVPQYAHVIEFALVRLRYRYGASIDRILADPELGESFETLALEVAPALTGEQLRLGALYIRKTRRFRKREVEKAQALNPTVVEKAMTQPISLAHINTDEVPSAPGLLELREGERYLYVARNENLRPAVEQLRTGRAFNVLANGFWQPTLEAISLRYVQGRKVGGVATTRWELRLIQAREPIFNWRMTKKEDPA